MVPDVYNAVLSFFYAKRLLSFLYHLLAAGAAGDFDFAFLFWHAKPLPAGAAPKIPMGFSVVPTVFDEVNLAGIDRKLSVSFGVVFGKYAEIAPKKKQECQGIQDRKTGEGGKKKKRKRENKACL